MLGFKKWIDYIQNFYERKSWKKKAVTKGKNHKKNILKKKRTRKGVKRSNYQLPLLSWCLGKIPALGIYICEISRKLRKERNRAYKDN